MTKLKRYIYIFALITTIVLAPISVYADEIDKKETIKVGFYDYEPYYFMNKDGKPDGYYNDLLNLLKKDLNIEVEYTMLDVSRCIQRLETGEIDLLLGLTKTPDREGTFLYTDHYVAVETFGIFTNEDIEFGKIDKLNGLKFAFIDNEANYKWIFDFLDEKGIEVEKVTANSYDHARELLLNKKVDAISATITDKTLQRKNMIYEYSSGPVYIGGSIGNEKLINEINELLEEYSKLDDNPLTSLQNKYFGRSIDVNLIKNTQIFVGILIFLIIVLIYSIIHPVLKKKFIQSNIRKGLNNDRYLLHYQAVVDPKQNKVVGFEALIRKRDSRGNIIAPYRFLKEIENSDMMMELSIWILKGIIKDYKVISEFDIVKNSDFYISMNISTDVLENEYFIEDVKTIMENSKIKENIICMEIVETVKISNLEKTKKNIEKLKKCNIKIAIDDFGVEHSNLDIIEKISFDIIKLDKYFIDGVESSEMRREIIKFLSNITNKNQQSIIAEGVENEYQKDFIKDINNENFYIQGYFYSKPVAIDNLKYIQIKKINVH